MGMRKREVGLYVGLGLFTAVTRLLYLPQLPPGLWFDEAWVSLAALGQETPVYFSASFGGMHPAIVYLTRLWQPLLNDHPLTIRYAVVWVSLLTVLGSVPVYRGIYGKTAEAVTTSRWYPWVGGFVLSILYPFFHFSRLGFESILPAPMALLAFGLLAGYTNQSKKGWGWLVGLGLACGLSLYAFDTGRFIPLGVAGAFWWLWWANLLPTAEGAEDAEKKINPETPRSPRTPRLKQAMGEFGLIVLVAVIVAAPLLLYFAQNWEQLTARAFVTTYNTLGPGAGFVPTAVFRNLTATLGGLFLPGWGDSIARHNLPGRPIFDPFLALLFLLGMWQLVRRPWAQSTAIYLPWLAFTLLPVILTDGAPTYTRLFGAVPALAGITAVGGIWLSQQRLRQRELGSVLLLIGLSFSTVSTLGDYFGRWAAHPALFDDFQVGEWQAAELALGLAQDGQVVYVAPGQFDWGKPTWGLRMQGEAVLAHPPAPCLLQSATQPTTYLVDRLADNQMMDWLAAQHGGDSLTPPISILHPAGYPLYETITLPPPTPSPAIATFGNELALHEANITPSDEAITLNLRWQAIAPPSADHTLFVHLYPSGAENSAPIAQLDVAPCQPTSQLTVGTYLLDQQTLMLPADLPPGAYSLAVGWYTYPTFARLAVSGEGTPNLPDNRWWLGEFWLGE
jgi:hypothetical protein